MIHEIDDRLDNECLNVLVNHYANLLFLLIVYLVDVAH